MKLYLMKNCEYFALLGVTSMLSSVVRYKHVTIFEHRYSVVLCRSIWMRYKQFQTALQPCRAGERGKYVTVCRPTQLQFTTLSSVERCKRVRVLVITTMLYNVLNTVAFCVERLHRSIQYMSLQRWRV